MKGLAKSVQCDGCETTLRDYHGYPIPGAGPLCDSIVFGAHDIVLCKNCSRNEFDEEEKHGTNNLPHLLKRYRTHYKFQDPSED